MSLEVLFKRRNIYAKKQTQQFVKASQKLNLESQNQKLAVILQGLI
jgi:hypothetical protein